MSEITYKIKGTITDSNGKSIEFTNKDIVNIEIETGTIKRVINNHAALKLQELVKERIEGHTWNRVLSVQEITTEHNLGLLLQSLVEESEK